MNVPAAGNTITIDIVSDMVCPWCFIGKRHLETALAQFEEPVSIRWLPYFLNPDTPPAGEPYRPFLERKFGGAAALEEIWGHLREAGKRAGIAFAFEKIERRANTLAAHRLIHRWQQKSDASPLVERLFDAGFCRGCFVGDPAVLAEIAAACGEDRDETLDWLQGDAEADAVIAQATHLRRHGIAGVPFFIFNGQLAVSGAQPPAVLLDALHQSVG